jgi:uncharacterized protein
VNRLARETSPYLLQHAENPVDWYPWGEEALDRARREDLPIFLSIGYSACHWCHVMAHESFEDPGIADLLNRFFVAIKVDREERPDLDALYMRSVQLLTGQGGWPLSVFLTPALRPFFGGTYFPAGSRRGIPSFRDVLLGVAEVFRDRRSEVEPSSKDLLRAVSLSFDPGEPRGGGPGAGAARASRDILLSRFDPVEGGFGAGPKFPQPPLLEFLLDEGIRCPGEGLIEKVALTLRKMEAGGIRDHVGGGFHRYSVDGVWRVPHYEKMLYDNAQLASLYFRVSGLSGDGEFSRVAEEVLADLSRSMACPGGGFVAALDADSEGEEGRFYLWTGEEMAEVLGDGAGAAASLYGIPFRGRALEEMTLHRVRPFAEAARDVGLPEDAFRDRVRVALSELRSAREARPRPGVDTKVLTDWNALAAKAFLAGYRSTASTLHLQTALETLDFVWARAWSGDRLHHVWDGRQAKVPGFLADHAFLAEAEWETFEVTGEVVHLHRVEALVRRMVTTFREGPGRPFFDTGPCGPAGDLPAPVREAGDGVLPSALSVLARVLWIWERFAGDGESASALDELLRFEAATLRRRPESSPLLAGLCAARAASSLEVVVAARDPGEARDLLEAARSVPWPGSLVVPYFADRVHLGDEGRYPLLRGRRSEAGPMAFVCVGRACLAPVQDPCGLKAALEGIVKDLRGLESR